MVEAVKRQKMSRTEFLKFILKINNSELNMEKYSPSGSWNVFWDEENYDRVLNITIVNILPMYIYQETRINDQLSRDRTKKSKTAHLQHFKREKSSTARSKIVNHTHYDRTGLFFTQIKCSKNHHKAIGGRHFDGVSTSGAWKRKAAGQSPPPIWKGVRIIDQWRRRSSCSCAFGTIHTFIEVIRQYRPNRRRERTASYTYIYLYF